MMASSAGQQMQADPLLVRCLTLHQTVLEHSRHGLTKEEIYQRVDGYAGRWRQAQLMDEAQGQRELQSLERRFSDDKRYLRQSGIPLEESIDVTGEHRYRIATDTYGLPEVDITEPERLVLAKVQHMFSQSTMRSLQAAVWALEGTDQDLGIDAVGSAFHASVASDEELNHLLDLGLIGMLHPVVFGYTRRGQQQAQTRRVVPLALGGRGHWYLVGHDLDRQEQRIFRLDRISGSVRSAEQRDLTSAQRSAAAELAASPPADPAGLVEIINTWEASHQRTEVLEAAVRAHQGPGRRPGRLRPARGHSVKDDNQLKTDRVINMAAYLLSEDGARPSQLMSRYSITADQLHRDLLSIEQSGPNVGMSRYVHVEPELPLTRGEFTEEYVASDVPITLTVPEGVSAHTLHQPVSLTKPGALSLLMGLSAFISMCTAEENHLSEAAVSLRAKILDLVPDSLASTAEAMTLSPAPVGQEHIPMITDAIDHHGVLALRYTDAAGETSDRVVEPVHVVYDGPHVYLHAWCRKAGAERYFRLSRMDSVTTISEGQRRGLEADELASSTPPDPRAQPGEQSVDRVVLRFAPFAAAQAARYAPQAQRQDSDGSVFIRTYFSSSAAAVRTCVDAGGDVELLAPEELRQEVWRSARNELERLRADSGT